MRLYTTDQGIARETTPGRLALLDLPCSDIGELLAMDPSLAAALEAATLDTCALDSVGLKAPVVRPSKMFCMSANYHSHLDREVAQALAMLNRPGAEEEIEALRRTPSFFGVPTSALCGPRDPIQLPAIAPDQVDYEIELAVVIGLGGKDIEAARAWQHIAGLTLANDVSARDLQRQAMSTPLLELGHAKGLDSFRPMGPCLVTLDEFSLPLDILLETRVNGALRQSERTSGMVHDIPHAVAQISRFFTLFPGDVILTGSPAGVGFFQQNFLRPGDVIDMRAEGIGALRNQVVG